MEDEDDNSGHWDKIIIVVVGVLMSGSWSVLNLGLLSLEVSDLELMMMGPFESKEEEQDAKMAKKILPLRRRTNTLICTILLWNTGTNSLISIMYGDLLGGIVGLLVSTFAIVIVGEIIP